MNIQYIAAKKIFIFDTNFTLLKLKKYKDTNEMYIYIGSSNERKKLLKKIRKKQDNSCPKIKFK